MIENVNFRYRGPIESTKCKQIIDQGINTVNDVIEKMQALLDETDITMTNVIEECKRRGSYVIIK